MQVAAAGKPKGICSDNDPTGGEQVEVGAYQILCREPTSSQNGVESWGILRQLDDGIVHGRAGAILEHHEQRGAAVADQREGVTRRSCQRLGADKRQDLRSAFRTQLDALAVGELVPTRQRHHRRERTERLILPCQKRSQPHAERVQRFLGAETAPIRGGRVVPTCDELFQRTNLRHHELVEIRREDAQEPQPCRDRRPGVLGELQHARIELEP